MALLISILFAFSIIFLVLALMRKVQPAIHKLNAYDELEEQDVRYNYENSGPIKRMATFLPKTLFASNNRLEKNYLLKQADIPFTIEEFFVIKLMFDISLPFLAFALTDQWIASLVTLVVLEMLFKLFLKMRRAGKIKAFDIQLNEGIVLIANALKAGYSFMQALAVASKETEDPLSKEFKQMLKEMSLGMSMEDALYGLSMRTPSEDLKLLVNAILIQKDVGGNLSEILENIAETIRERQKIKNEVKTLTAQGRLSGMIIMLLPVFLGGMIFLINPSYISILFTTQLGRLLVVFALFNQLIGWLFIRKIIKIEL